MTVFNFQWKTLPSFFHKNSLTEVCFALQISEYPSDLEVLQGLDAN